MMGIQDTSAVRSVNWHLTSRCNYACKFCFAHDRGVELQEPERFVSIFKELRDRGLEKINFAGGEPLLHPRFYEILHMAKDAGFVTSIVTNGFLLDRNALERCHDDLDWVGISIDSSSDEVEKELGRGDGHHIEHAVKLIREIHEVGIKLKINTVVTKLNFNEKMGPFIESLAPQRWKVFQHLHMIGCNDEYHEDLEVTSDQFCLFKRNNETTRLQNGKQPIFERNEDMLGSYLMLSPDGCLTSDRGGCYEKIGWESFTTRPVSGFVDVSRYIERGGIYNW